MGPLSFYKVCVDYSDPIIEKLAEYLKQSLIITDQQETCIGNPGCQTLKVKGSSTRTDIPVSRLTENNLQRNDCLQAQQSIFLQNKAIMTANKATLVKDSLAQLAKNQLSTSVDSRCISSDSSGPTKTLPINSILELWERSKIPKGRDILLRLGFNSDNINMAQLSNALEEEIATLNEEAPMMLMKACLVLQSTELSNLRQTNEQLHDENSKLRADNKDANNRIVLLAAQVEELRASSNDAIKTEIHSLQKQYAGVIGDHTSHFDDDCENWSTFKTRFEAHLKTFGIDDIKLTPELELVRKERDDLESGQHQMQKQYTDLLEKNSVEHHELTEYDESTHLQQRYNDEEVFRIVEKMAALQIGRCYIRANHDERISEVKSSNHNQNISKITAITSYQYKDENCVANTITKRSGDSPIEESPRLEKFGQWTYAGVQTRTQDLNLTLAIDDIEPKPDLELIRNDNDDFENGKHKMQKQFIELLEKNTELQHELPEFNESVHLQQRYESHDKAVNNEEVLHPVEKPSSLQFGSCNTRDRHNELIADAESLNHDRNKSKIKAKKSAENIDVSCKSTTAPKLRGESSIEDTPRLDKIRKSTNGEVESRYHGLNRSKIKAKKTAENIDDSCTLTTTTKRRGESSIEDTPRHDKIRKCTNAEVESRNHGLNKWKIKAKKSAENIDDSSTATTTTKRKGESSIEDTPRHDKIRKCTNAEVESRNHGLNKWKIKAKKSAENIDDSCTSTTTTKRKGESSIEDTPRHDKIRKCTNAEVESRNHGLNKWKIKAKKSAENIDDSCTSTTTTKRKGESSIEDTPRHDKIRKCTNAEVESRYRGLNKWKIKAKKPAENIDASCTSTTATKRRRDSSIEESTRLDKCRKCSNSEDKSRYHDLSISKITEKKSAENLDGSFTSTTVTKCSWNSSIEEISLSNCIDDSFSSYSDGISDTSSESMRLFIEPLRTRSKVSKQVQEDMKNMQKKISELEEQLNQDQFSSSAAQKGLLQELEQTLNAYEDCENFWQFKWMENSTLFENDLEISEEEQQEDGKKFDKRMEMSRGALSARKMFEEKCDEIPAEVGFLMT